jgi:hypothetical protein
MLFGVMIFSYVMGELVSMLDKVKKLIFVEFEEEQELGNFFGVLTRFNSGI